MFIYNFGKIVEIAQSSDDVLIWVAFISAASAIASATIVGYVNYRTGKNLEQQRFENNNRIETQKIEHTNQLERQRIEISDRQTKQQAYSQLSGRKSLVLQTNISYLGALIRSELCNSSTTLSTSFDRLKGIDLLEIELKLKGSVDYQLGLQARQRSEDLELQTAKSEDSFWETIGHIQVVFPHTSELEAFVEQLHEIKKRLRI
jgi:hypothetical protein